MLIEQSTQTSSLVIRNSRSIIASVYMILQVTATPITVILSVEFV